MLMAQYFDAFARCFSQAGWHWYLLLHDLGLQAGGLRQVRLQNLGATFFYQLPTRCFPPWLLGAGLWRCNAKTWAQKRSPTLSAALDPQARVCWSGAAGPRYTHAAALPLRGPTAQARVAVGQGLFAHLQNNENSFCQAFESPLGSAES